MKSIVIVTGEASGDMHGANLVRALLEKSPDLVFHGMGGVEMREAGVDLLLDSHRVSVVGIAEVISRLPDILSAQQLLRKYLKKARPDLLIIIDLPDFNLLLARKACDLGIPVFYYICPQLWAWRSGRAKTIAKLVDAAGVILPFEEPFLREHGVNAHYVGHPLLDSVRVTEQPVDFKKRYQIPEGNKCIGLLPGSRLREISSLMPIFVEAAVELQRQHTDPVTFLVPLAAAIPEEKLWQNCSMKIMEGIDIRVIHAERYNLMAACDAAVAASGTVTLELALLDIPMVVVYKLAPLTYRIGKMLIKLDMFSLVNLIARREVVPELLQEEVNVSAIVELVSRILSDRQYLLAMKQGLSEVRDHLGSPGASARAAELVLEVIEGKA